MRVGQGFDIVGAAQRVDHVADRRFLLQDDLGVARDAGRKISGQADGLVERIGVQRLGAAQHGRKGLERSADDVVVGVLLR